jgi:Glyoxalase-like domain
MPNEFQIAVDCAQPHMLADWWADTLGWQVVVSDPEFIRRMIAEGHITEADTRVHNGTLVFAAGRRLTTRRTRAGAHLGACAGGQQDGLKNF